MYSSYCNRIIAFNFPFGTLREKIKRFQSVCLILYYFLICKSLKINEPFHSFVSQIVQPLKMALHLFFFFVHSCILKTHSDADAYMYYIFIKNRSRPLFDKAGRFKMLPNGIYFNRKLERSTKVVLIKWLKNASI